MDEQLITGDCLEVLRSMPGASVDSIITDPPYGLNGKPPPLADVLRAWLAGEVYLPKGRGFMGKAWDAYVPGPEVWRECLRVLKPGGHLLAFYGTRTYHLGATAIELAGFEPRDMVSWLYGSGFPKSLDVSKAIDKAAGIWRGRAGSVVSSNAAMAGPNYTRTNKGQPATPEAAQWAGWGTALKPALEPVCVARKPLVGTVAANVLAHGTGAINVDGCRIGTETRHNPYKGRPSAGWGHSAAGQVGGSDVSGRWPANVVLDEEAAAILDEQSGVLAGRGNASNGRVAKIKGEGASRFFYCAKASQRERHAGLDPKGNRHPTVKPVDLMRWLVRLVTPPGGLVVDPFCGSGTTGIAAIAEGFRFVGIERDEAYVEIARRRLAHAKGCT